MKVKDQKTEKVFVTLSLADGTELQCKIFASFDVNGKYYVALLPMDPDGNPDTSAQIMLYRLEEDAEHNPVVSYIADDSEYSAAVDAFTALCSNSQN